MVEWWYQSAEERVTAPAVYPPPPPPPPPLVINSKVSAILYSPELVDVFRYVVRTLKLQDIFNKKCCNICAKGLLPYVMVSFGQLSDEIIDFQVAT